MLGSINAHAYLDSKPIEPASTIPSTGAWFMNGYPYPPSGNAALFNGYPDAKTACEAYRVNWVSIQSAAQPIIMLSTASYTLPTQGYPASLLQECFEYTFPFNATYSRRMGNEFLYQKCPVGFTMDSRKSPNLVAGSPTSMLGPTNTDVTLSCNRPAQCPTVPAGQPQYVLDPGGATCSRNMPVPPPSTTEVCPLSLTPMTDLAALDFEKGNRWRPDLLSPTYQVKLKCVQDGITVAGGTYENTSAFRPWLYQLHLWEIIKFDVALDPQTLKLLPGCQSLRNILDAEIKTHGLKYNQDVAIPGKSRHQGGALGGEAFDVTPSLTKVQMLPIYQKCGVSNTVVKKEPWHTQ